MVMGFLSGASSAIPLGRTTRYCGAQSNIALWPRKINLLSLAFEDSGPRDRQEILEFWPEPGFLEFAMAPQGAGSDPRYGATRRFLRLCCAQILGAHVLRRFRLA
jgi:hypothetical protein